MTVTVDPILPITGSPTVCQGNTATLTDGVAGGTWASSNPAAATIGVTGTITGATAGVTTIIYTTGSGCTATASVTVNPLAPIAGSPVLCAGNTTTLSDATAGGTWSSGTASVATIDAATGIVTGVAAGTSAINYTTASGCVGNITVTVNAVPSAIGGPAAVCQGNTVALTNLLSGGTWSSSAPATAPISAATGSLSGLFSGVATISYTTAAGCFMTTTETVNPLSAIAGGGAICAGNTTVLTDATPGGTWGSTATAVATIDAASGLLTGVSGGASIILYTTPAGCVATFTETINALPAAITGTTSVCIGNTTALADATAGGAWSSGSAAIATVDAVSGMTTGISAGTVIIAYTTTSGCIATTAITVNPLPASITGVASMCVGNTTLLSDVTTGTWSSGSPSIATISATTGITSGIAAGLAIASYTTPAGCYTTLAVTVNPVPGTISGTTIVCEGALSPLSDPLAGGAWSSTVPAVATIGSSTGILDGITAGTTTISYITPAGCFVVAEATINPTPVISSVASGNPTTCTTNNGTILLNGLTPGETFTVGYLFGTTPVTLPLTADATGQVKITGLAAGSYSVFTVTTALGCTSGVVAGPVVLSLPAPPPAPIAGNNTPVCEGSPVNFTAIDGVSGITYSWSGPGGFTSSLQNPSINPSVLTEAGTYTVTATNLGCVSAPATTTVVIHPIPTITKVSSLNPTTCQGADGSITLTGLAPGVSYTITYSYNGVPATATLTADTSGSVVLSSLPAGAYTNFNASSFTCRSNTAGPVTLADPNPPPVPTLGSNSPICAGKTLSLTSTDARTGLSYKWTGPDGFTSASQDPEIPNVALADSGVYTLVVKYQNCTATASEQILVHPAVTLVDVTASQKIGYGSSLQLFADGAELYLWSPDNGTLNNPNINNPVATPLAQTVYIVTGMNTWGCRDSASVTLDVDDDITEIVPTAFTPNNDGRDDVFRILNLKYDQLVEFSIFNRWGQRIYFNTTDPKQGWDGTFNGVPQDMGTYFYNIILSTTSGAKKEMKGEVTLIR